MEPTKSDPKAERERRQAEALKANLRRRKAQARAKSVAEPGEAAPRDPLDKETG